jgi:GntR family transcriptional regulator, carbon starvation induced regulator
MMQEPDVKPTAISLALTALRADVLSLAHAPGSKLKLDELQNHYGLSSSPLREALNRLAEEGLVFADDRRGFFVPSMSVQDIRDITALRLMIDLQALEFSIDAGGDDWEAAVLTAFHRLDKVESRLPHGPVILDTNWASHHRQFHMQLLAACSSERMLRISKSLFDQAERYRHLSARYRTTTKRKGEEHRLLMQATLKRNKPRATALLRQHIQATERNAISVLRKHAEPKPRTH